MAKFILLGQSKEFNAVHGELQLGRSNEREAEYKKGSASSRREKANSNRPD